MEAESRGEGETLARHERTLIELARRQNLNITAIYREIVSGETIAARPVMQQLLSEVERGLWNGVLVMEVERLARGDTIDQGIIAQTFKFTDTLIITPTKTYDPRNEFDEEYFEFGLFMSRREYKTINRRLQRGRIAAVKEGKFVTSTPPYGYARVKLKTTSGYTLEPVESEAEVVRMIFDLYTSGEQQPDGSYRRLGVSLIARKLNALGIPSATGGKWASVSIRDLINNPVYIGKIRWNWRRTKKHMDDGQIVISKPRSPKEDCLIVDGLHPAIVDTQVWNDAQGIMAKVPPAPIGAKSTVKNPLSGLIMCDKCGHRMVRRPYSGKHANQAPSLVCTVNYCDNTSAPLYLVEKSILVGLSDWVKSYRLKWEPDTDSDVQQTSGTMLKAKQNLLAKRKAELVTFQKQLDTAHDLLEQGVYTVDVFLERSRSLSTRIEECTATISAIEAEVTADEVTEEVRTVIIPKVEHLLSVYNTLDDEKTKNEMLKEVIEKVTYLKTVNGRWHNDPSDFTIVIFPRVPGVEGFVYNPVKARKN